ncbi:agmatinase [Gordonia sp. CPCC 205515]|uniref:agmatinase n=1 Tax=Gordonia sp. CPCC 205515 TaxID=3140791 RepID=UPI003AF3A5C2
MASPASDSTTTAPATDVPVGPVDGLSVPRFAGHSTFARLPRIEDVNGHDVAVVGVPFDTGVTYRPGARFGPAHIRQSSRLLKTYNPALGVEPFAHQQVVDAGDIAVNPFDITAAMTQIEHGAYELVRNGERIVSLGGDHTIAYPLLKALNRVHGPVALVHFDAHLDTWDTYFNAPLTHGTPFRRAAEEGLFLSGHSAHVGTRGSLYSSDDLVSDAGLGFHVVDCRDFIRRPIDDIISELATTIGNHPLYVSIDIDVLDPCHAPGTGTPEAGGMSSRELLELIRSFAGLNLVGADIVEVAPAYDHAEITGMAAAALGFELISVIAATSR